MVPARNFSRSCAERKALRNPPQQSGLRFRGVWHGSSGRPTSQKAETLVRAVLGKPNPPNDNGNEAESGLLPLDCVDVKKIVKALPDPLIMRPGELSNCIWFNHSEELVGLGRSAMQQQ